MICGTYISECFTNAQCWHNWHISAIFLFHNAQQWTFTVSNVKVNQKMNIQYRVHAPRMWPPTWGKQEGKILFSDIFWRDLRSSYWKQGCLYHENVLRITFCFVNFPKKASWIRFDFVTHILPHSLGKICIKVWFILIVVVLVWCWCVLFTKLWKQRLTSKLQNSIVYARWGLILSCSGILG